MSNHVFRALLDLVMVSDPWPLVYGNDLICALLDEEARKRGFDDWIHAYHKMENPA